MAKRARVQLPADLLRELIPIRPSPVPAEVYADGPTARTMRRPAPEGFVVVGSNDSRDDRHAAAEDAALTLCGLPVVNVFPLASLLIVECPGCVGHLPLPAYNT